MMTVIAYMEMNGDSFFTFPVLTDRMEVRTRIRPKNRAIAAVMDSVYHMGGTTDLKHAHNEMRWAYKRYKHHARPWRANDYAADRAYKEYLTAKKRVKKLSAASVAAVSGRKTMERLVYLEDLIYRIENDHRIDDLDLKEMIAEKLEELKTEVLSDE
jgi:hypothetical protein